MTSACGFGIMIGWLCKLLVLKYGGPKPYQRLRPLFLGFILGQICGTGTRFPCFRIILRGKPPHNITEHW